MSLKVGELYLYNIGSEHKPIYKLVLITDGSYEINGRISNYWYFVYVNPFSGYITNEEGGDYDNKSNGFIKISSNLYKKTFDLRKLWNKYFVKNKKFHIGKR